MTEVIRLGFLENNGCYYVIEKETEKAILLGERAYRDGALVHHAVKWLPKKCVKLSPDRATLEIPNWLSQKPWRQETIIRMW